MAIEQIIKQIKAKHKPETALKIILDMAQSRCEHGHSLLSHPQCRGYEERQAFVDLEATSLNASFGYILSVSLLCKGGGVWKRAVKPEEIRNHTFDKNLMKEFCDKVWDYDRLIGYYSERYDIPFLRTRAELYNLNFPKTKEMRHTDLWKIMKYKFKLHSNRLEAACDFFGIPSKGHRLIPSIWQKAQTGDKKALDFVLTHNIEDVKSTQELYYRIIKYIKVGNTSV